MCIRDSDQRVRFLDALEININAEDEAFLETQLKDKSSRVKAEALRLLQLIPNSRISLLYLDYLKSAMEVGEERVMLISKKKKINLIDVKPQEELFKLGMEKISSEKGVKDHHFWIAQSLPL